MIERIVVMRHVILSKILGSWPLLPPMLPTPWINGNSEQRMAGDKQAAGLLIASSDDDHYRNEVKSVHVSLIIWANFCSVKILNNQLHDSHTRS